ncbi:RcnB family protein [Oleiagrimonas sp. C23AA]|uniref:RcnB family protein n=1 Tax=Oleiagrimonas sp. C23AA TaxID=2719047 RepID=UPI0031B73419
MAMAAPAPLDPPSWSHAGGHGHDHDRDYHRDHRRDDHHHWRRGDHYRADRVVVVRDYRTRHLRRPPRGYHWVRDDSGQYLLVAIASGVIADIVLHSH